MKGGSGAWFSRVRDGKREIVEVDGYRSDTQVEIWGPRPGLESKPKRVIYCGDACVPPAEEAQGALRVLLVEGVSVEVGDFLLMIRTDPIRPETYRTLFRVTSLPKPPIPNLWGPPEWGIVRVYRIPQWALRRNFVNPETEFVLDPFSGELRPLVRGSMARIWVQPSRRKPEWAKWIRDVDPDDWRAELWPPRVRPGTLPLMANNFWRLDQEPLERAAYSFLKDLAAYIEFYRDLDRGLSWTEMIPDEGFLLLIRSNSYGDVIRVIFSISKPEPGRVVLSQKFQIPSWALRRQAVPRENRARIDPFTGEERVAAYWDGDEYRTVPKEP